MTCRPSVLGDDRLPRHSGLQEGVRNMAHLLNRRRFLSRVAVTGGTWHILQSARTAFSYEANEKVAFAAVGLGKRGSYLAPTFARIGGQLVALCDANQSKIATFAQKFPKATVHQDFRKMLDQCAKSLDAVVVATPDHTHAVISAAAMHCGKHVYCEKPITHDAREARTLRELAAQQKVATQMGNQGMATDSFRRTLEQLEDGVIGHIREAHLWFVFGGSGPRQLPEGSPPVPAELNWDTWLGPAADRPYHPQYISGWGGWWDFGTGCLGGGGSHSFNLTFKAMGLRDLWNPPASPAKLIRVESEVPEHAPHGFPRWQWVRFHIPARGDRPQATIYWYNANEDELRRQGVWKKLEDIAGRDLEWKDNSWTPRSGTLLVGEKGIVHTNAHNSVCQILPLERFPSQAGPPKRYAHVAGHEYEWLDACRGRGNCMSHFDHSGPVIELLLVANVAGRFDEPLEFDPVNCRITNNEGADALMRPAYRAGWSL